VNELEAKHNVKNKKIDILNDLLENLRDEYEEKNNE